MNFKLKLFVEKATDFIKRNGAWLLLGFIAFLALGPAEAALRTILLLILIEAVALALSGLAAYAYTKIDFTRHQMWNTLGSIFLGVHICIGLVVMGVYFTQF